MALLNVIISHCGVVRVSNAVKVSPRAIYKWLERGHLPRTEFTGETHYAEAISELSDGAYSPEEVREAGRPSQPTN